MDHVAQEVGAGVFARSGRGLQDDRAVHFISAHHDGAHLFEVVDVESGDAVVVFGGVVEQLTQTDKCHGSYLFKTK